jgi:mono/diheme cytochrome c family protein
MSGCAGQQRRGPRSAARSAASTGRFTRLVWGHLPAAIILATAWFQGILLSQTNQAGARALHTGKEIFRAACVGCHGPDGKGMPRSTAGFEPPSTFPDFTDCNATTREPDVLWRAIIFNGGPARGFSEIMPSFAEALSREQIEAVIHYLRGFCREPAWPRGELNLPRALVTEKAFPEDEVVISTTINATGEAQLANKFVYERRFGRANQLEVILPFDFVKRDSRTWFGGVGDLTLGYKRMLASSLRSGSIFSLSGEVVVPTGNKSRGLGGGVTVVEGFAAYGQLLPNNSFLQFQSGVEIPVHGEDAAKAVFWRTALGKSYAGDKGRGRLWSPMVEVLADRELGRGQQVNWDVVPQAQVTLSQRQHIRANFGVRVPLNNTASRPVQFIFYLLWDWFDGGLRDGWK